MSSPADAWYLHETEPHAYEVTVDPDRTRHLRSRPAIAGSGVGTTMQMFAADRYRGKRVRFAATVRATDVLGWAGLWMRAADAHAIALGILLHGTGEVVLVTPILEPVGPDVPETGAPLPATPPPLPDDFRP